MRFATKNDCEFIAQCIVESSRFIKSIASDAYIDGMPEEVDTTVYDFAAQFIETDNAISLIAEIENDPIACLLGKIEETSFPPSNIGSVGHIALCWVSEKYRKKGIGKDMVHEAEDWFSSSGVKNVELSYLAKNSIAEKVWASLGYNAFRVFTYKEV